MRSGTNDWSRAARERRRHFKGVGLSPKLAAQLVRAERNAKNRLASAIGRKAADKARLAYIDGDPQPIKLLMDDCHLNDEQRQIIAPLCSGFTRNN